MNKALFLLLILAGSPVFAVPVVPNFSAGSVTSRTESTQDTREIIKSYSYSTGYTYAVGGTNITGSGTISPTNTTVGTQTLNGVLSWTGVNSLLHGVKPFQVQPLISVKVTWAQDSNL